MNDRELFANPELRANDINRAFSDPKIQGIISSIGGSDSARILQYLDIELLKNNPKFIMGYSDFTTINTWLNQHGLVTFNGPSVMAGFAQYGSFKEEYQKYLNDYLFKKNDKVILPTFSDYWDGDLSWGEKENTGRLNILKENDGLHFLNGSGKCKGKLFGGCIEVLEMLKGTDFWPEKDFWDNKILFLETSEEKPSIDYVKYWLRNYGVMGVFDRISGLLFGRPRDYSFEEKKQLEITISSVIKDEFGNLDLPIVCNIDFGHTDPQLILPLGIEFEINIDAKQIVQLESAFEDSI
jgi:muramoyltetrapeptide carboxypeptidase LdcA involved in peptidoglycan recycling